MAQPPRPVMVAWKFRRATLSLMGGILALLLVGCDPADRSSSKARLAARLAATNAPPQTSVPCAQIAAQQPLVLLVLGQSNAGNHGSGNTDLPPLPMVSAAGTCHLAQDPLPGGTGQGQSPWPRLPAALQQLGIKRPVLVALLAVDATTSAEWAEPSGPIGARLDQMAQALHAQGLVPHYVLWHQGEADARAGTRPEAHQAAVETIAANMRSRGISAPWLLALSTRCRSEPSAAIRGALRSLIQGGGSFKLGPDTDALGDDHRSDGCHFNEQGLTATARLWAQAISVQESHRTSAPGS